MSNDVSRIRAHGPISQLPLALRLLENWPSVDENQIAKPADRERYRKRLEGIAHYLQGGLAKESAERAGIGERRFYRLLSRCAMPHEDGGIVGLRALAPRVQLVKNVRQQPLGNHPRGIGHRGLFRKLLADHPNVADHLECVLGGMSRSLNVITHRDMNLIVSELKAACRRDGISELEYPLNTTYPPRRALQDWINQVYFPKYSVRYIRTMFGEEAAQRASYASGQGQSVRQPTPYETWQIDEVTIDVATNYARLSQTGELEYVRLPRCKAIRIIEVSSHAVLATHLVLAPDVTKDDVIIAFWKALNPSKFPADAADALEANAAYPAEAFPALAFAVCTHIMLDNALAHLANSVQLALLLTLSCVVTLGKPRTPQARKEIEASFGKLARGLLHKVAGTCGSGPRDTKRSKGDVSDDKLINERDLANAIDAYGRNANALPTQANNNLSPLMKLAQAISRQKFEPTRLPEQKRHPRFFFLPIKCKISGNIAKGKPPSVDYMYATYRASWLNEKVGWIGRSINILCDHGDMRLAWIYDEKGNQLGPGPLSAMGQWGQFPNDIRMRKLWGKFRRESSLAPGAHEKPLSYLVRVTSDRAKHDRRAAQQLAYILAHFRAQAPEFETSFDEQGNDPTWSADAARHSSMLPSAFLTARTANSAANAPVLTPPRRPNDVPTPIALERQRRNFNL